MLKATTRIVPAAANRVLTTSAPTAYMIRGGGTKWGPGRMQRGALEFAQEALRKIPNRKQLSSRKREAAVNDLLARAPEFWEFRSRFGKRKKIHRRTVDRAQKAMDALNH